MVVKPFSHLARQSFGKTFTHGYAQSVVAATQSSYASTTTPLVPFGPYTSNRYGRPGTAQAHAGFHSGSGLVGLAGKNAHGISQASDGHDSRLSAYVEAWQKHHLPQAGENKEWKQPQLAKRVGWKQSATVATGEEAKIDESAAAPSEDPRLAALERSYSTSAVDDIKRAEDVVAEAAAIAKVDNAVAAEIASQKEIQEDPAVSSDQKLLIQPEQMTPSTQSPRTFVDTASPPTSFSGNTSSPVSDDESQAYLRHIERLQHAGAYSQIPSVFAAMLSKGIKPDVQAYNHLLESAIRESRNQHQVVPRALNIYADMLRKRITPDTRFFSSLLKVLSRRALDVFDQKIALEQKLQRFQSMKAHDSFFFGSHEAEYAILREDDALKIALEVFNSSTLETDRVFTAETYQFLVTACAAYGALDPMMRAYEHMEENNVRPSAQIFPPMIEAFGKSGDLASAVECYNEYKVLAMEDDKGKSSLKDRRDGEIYAAVAQAYRSCGRTEGADRFTNKIITSFEDGPIGRREKLAEIQENIILNATLKQQLAAKDFSAALQTAEESLLTPQAYSEAMARVCVAAADHSDELVASKAYQHLSSRGDATENAALALLSLNIRLGHQESASDLWKGLKSSAEWDTTLIEPTTFYVMSLLKNGRIEEGLSEASEAFDRIRSIDQAVMTRREVTDQIDEAIELVVSFLGDNRIAISPDSSLNLLWAMVNNDGLISSSAERLLASLGPDDITGLSWQDIRLVLQTEAGLIGNGEACMDIAHSLRFEHLLSISMHNGIPLDEETLQLVDKAVSKLATELPELSSKWQQHRRFLDQSAPPSRSFSFPTRAPFSPTAVQSDTYDPHSATTDFKGSAIIVDELEARRNGAGLTEALRRFRNIRLAGRHPRYAAYAKLISAAAREGRVSLTDDILGMARTDVPFIASHPAVLSGWVAILDAMVGACLTSGRRSQAEQVHQELLAIGAAPTANTFGLYITTLKESTKTFDEATEAVSIFNRAISEGVIPSSFLYNALIGKLGKARRIDDCLRYFQEMRGAGIRPTSVTYGTIVNALCRVSDERFAEELFDEMESMPNYKPRPAPYNSLMQFFLTTKRDSRKVLTYYERMRSRNIEPTMHTYKLLIDTYATLEPINLSAAEEVLSTIRSTGQLPEAVHYASLIHAKGCVLHDMAGARQVFEQALNSGQFRPQPCLYQALFESMVANHCVSQTESILDSMSANRVEITPYIANTLIHGWATENKITRAKAIFDSVSIDKREPSTYEAMTRAYLTVEDRDGAMTVVHEMLSRGYPAAVSNKVLELVGHGN